MNNKRQPTLTHLNSAGEAHMVDVSGKAETTRIAVARSYIHMQPETLTMITSGKHKKGDVFAVARIAGIQAAKKCADLIPLCHPLMLTKIEVDICADIENHRVKIDATCKLCGKTGVEMEALTAASIAALTIYDMCKAVDKTMIIASTQVLEKSGGKSGDWVVTEANNGQVKANKLIGNEVIGNKKNGSNLTSGEGEHNDTI